MGIPIILHSSTTAKNKPNGPVMRDGNSQNLEISQLVRIRLFRVISCSIGPLNIDPIVDRVFFSNCNPGLLSGIISSKEKLSDFELV